MIAKKRRKEKIFQIISTLVFIPLFLTLLFFNWKIFLKRKKLEKEMISLKAQIENLKKEKEIYQQKLSKIEKRFYLEKLLREKYNYKKKGEEVYDFIFPQKEEKEKEKELKWFEKLKKILFDFFQ